MKTQNGLSPNAKDLFGIIGLAIRSLRRMGWTIEMIRTAIDGALVQVQQEEREAE